MMKSMCHTGKKVSLGARNSLVPSPRSTHLGSGNMYLITSRESYSCECACSRKDFSTRTSDFFSCYNLIIK